MKRMLTFAIGAVMAAATLPAIAQDAFPDVPENHWAYEALARMKAAGLLVGYPDGLFRGTRPASRYEMAVALHALYQHLKGLADGLQAQHDALKTRVDNIRPGEGGVSADQLKQMQDALASLRSQVDGMKSWGDDIAALKRMTSTFERELASMGVDVEAVKKAVADLAARVEALEGKSMPVNIGGELNLVLYGGNADNPEFGMGVDGRPWGVKRDGSGDPTSWTHDLTVGHEGMLALSGNNKNGPKWEVQTVIGNTTHNEGFISTQGFSNSQFLWGDYSGVFPGIPFGEPETDIWVHRAAVMFATTLWGMAFEAELGRVGLALGPYTFRRVDNTPYSKIGYRDDHKWIFDGGIFRFKLGCTNFTMFGGRQSNRLTSDGAEINPMWAGQAGHTYDPLVFGIDERPRGFGEVNGIRIDQHLGFNVEVPLMNRATINLNYIFLDSNNTFFLGNSMFANRAIVMGGDINFKVNNQISVFGGYSQSDLQEDGDDVIDEDNAATWAGIHYMGNRFGVKLGWRSIDPQFYAPADWGRIGIWWNPTNIEGIFGHVSFDLSDQLGLMVSGGSYRGKEVDLNGVVGLLEDDKVTHVSVKLNYKVNESWTAMFGVEQVNWTLEDRIIPAGGGFAGGDPTEQWITLGLRYAMGPNAWWGIGWQMSDYDSDDVVGWNPFSFFGGTEAKGSLLFSQLGIKF